MNFLRVKWPMASDELASTVFFQRLLMNLSIANFEQTKDALLQKVLL
jgi:hypothetical protein